MGVATSMATSTSYESTHCSAYNDDLRWRMVYQRMALGLPYHTVAMNLGIDASTVCRIIQLFERTGQVSKMEYNTANCSRKLTDTVQFFIV